MNHGIMVLTVKWLKINLNIMKMSYFKMLIFIINEHFKFLVIHLKIISNNRKKSVLSNTADFK